MATFSVIVGSAGRPQLRTMLESIKRQQRQPGDQCIVIFDAHEQGTREDLQELVQSYGEGFIAGAYDAGYHWLGVEQVNYALTHAPVTGSHVLLLGDDDVFVDGAYEKIRPVCDAHPGQAVLWQVVMPHSKSTGRRAVLPKHQSIERGKIGGSSIAAPRECVGLHNTSRYVSHDFDWLSEVIQKSGMDPVWLMEALVVTRPETGGFDAAKYSSAGTRTPKRLITTWICDEKHGAYRETDKRLFYRCLESWHRLMPDYDIRIVSSGNIFEYGSDAWAEQQLRAMNGIALSQWAKVWWTYQIGGISLDMDQQAVERFDGLLDGTYFTGHFGAEPFVGNGITGAPQGHPFLLEQLAYLPTLNTDDPQFGNESGPRMVTRLLKAKGWDGANRFCRLDGGITVYPHTTFYPCHWRERYTPACLRPDTVAVHHWASSWDQQNPHTPAWRKGA